MRLPWLPVVRPRLHGRPWRRLGPSIAVVVLAWSVAAGQTGQNEFANRPLNEGWRFFRGNPAGAEQAGFDDHDWRTVDLPHDWSIEDLPARKDDPLYAVIDLVPGFWKFNAGDQAGWSALALDDSEWQTVAVPGSWTASRATPKHAIGWYRRHFNVPANAAGKTIMLAVGTIHNQCWIFLDGKKVGDSGAGMWSNAAIKSQLVELSAGSLASGDHVIAVRVQGDEHGGGIVAAVPPPQLPSPCDAGRSSGSLNTGYAVGGTGWYRQHFTLAADDRDKHVRVVFDGSYMETTVWLNGHQLGQNFYGYSPFGFDLTNDLQPPGEENVLAVKVENEGANSRWYSGSGLYRSVHLEFGGAAQLALWGLAVKTTRLKAAEAQLEVTAELQPAADDSRAAVSIDLLDPSGKAVGHADAVSLSSTRAGALITLRNPQPWSPETPDLYQAVARVRVDGKVTDQKSTKFGIRTLAWNAQQGLLLNGKSIKLRGGCVHHDFGPLGSASFPMAEARRVKTLKDAGYNAIRCSHNMPSTAFLDACDRLGMLVLDEAFDMWTVPKNPLDYARFFATSSSQDVTAMVRRDRNHPSVIMWSIGNEIPERFDSAGVHTAHRLADLIHSLDATRPVTAAFNNVNADADPFFQALDICGYNYCPDSFAPDHARVPDRVMFTTESYPKDSTRYWDLVEKLPYVIGDFVWTAWDYRGESGIGHTLPQGVKSFYLQPWPFMDASCGDFDTCGFVKPQGLFRQVMWGARKLAIEVDDLPPGKTTKPDLWGWGDEEPVWDFAGIDGQERTVHVYGLGDSATLTLNGQLVGTEKIAADHTATFHPRYSPGKLTADLFEHGQQIAEQSLETPGPAAALRINVENSSLPADKESVAFLTIDAVDNQGREVPTANQLVSVSLTGPSSLAAFGNGDPQNVGSVQCYAQFLWRGKALLVVRSKGSPGVVTVTATAAPLIATQKQISFTSSNETL